jgi:hypothetical protein
LFDKGDNPMPAKCERAVKALTLLLVFSLLHLSLATAQAGAGLTPDAAARMQGAVTGKLFTRGNQSIFVNGIQTQSGATILTGAMIETPDLVGASIRIGSMGILDIAPNTKLKVEFGRDGTIKVLLMEGCVNLRINPKMYGVIYIDDNIVTSNDVIKRQGVVLDVCQPKGAPAAIINQGAAANAGAGAGGNLVITDGLNKTVLWSLGGGGIGLTILALVIANRGDDTSQSS